MITDERTATYIDLLNGGNSHFLEQLEKQAIEDGIPIIRPVTQSFMKFILADKEPERILEVGAAVGFSAILMATYTGDTAKITTIENYEPRIVKARHNIKESGFSDKIKLIEADALETLQALAQNNEQYDMIFVDAAKGQYINYLPYVKQMLVQKGILISDNILFDGDIIESRYAVRRRDRTIHARIREYLRTLCDDSDFTTTVLPIGDGMTISVRN